MLHLLTTANHTGVSVFDSRSVKDVDPGEDGKPWFELMKHLHLRPIEHKELVNKRFVKGHPDNFNFGESDLIKLDDTGRVLERIFSDPSRIHEACNFDTEISDVAPTIMLIGHDLKNDTEYLRKLNFTPKHVAGKIDTQRLARISKSQPPGLTKLLAALSIDAKYLHNAGNDAAYTLQALIGVAVQEHYRPGEIVRLLKAEKEVRDAAKASNLAKKEARDAAKAAKLARKANVDKSNVPSANPKTVGKLKVSAKIVSPSGVQTTGQTDESRREHKSRVRHEREGKGE